MTQAILNLDLLSVGLATAGIGILGCLVFFSNSRSITTRTFLFLAISTSIWSVFNYLFYNLPSADLSLWFLRLVMFSAVWFAFFLFQLLFVFPNESSDFPKFYKTVLVPSVVFISGITLSPLVFSGIKNFPDTGVPIAEVGFGIIPFGLIVMSLDLLGIVIFSKKLLHSNGMVKKQMITVLIGVIITIFLILIFNFILPAFFDISRFIPLSAVFIFPFIVFTAYAIFKHHLLNVKVISTEILTFILAVVMLFEVVITKDPLVLVFRVGVFVLVLSFGILLIRSVRKEVEQREQLQKLSDDLKDANGKLEDLSRFKTQLLSLASHQIKSPLAAIKGFAEILIEGLYGQVPDKVKETLGKMKQSADGLVELINTLLDVRKVEEGKMNYEFARADFGKLVSAKVEELRQLAVQKKITLEFTPPTTPIWINADAQKLSQVIQNLVDNAIKYTPAGSVKVTLEVQGDSALLTVTDTGLGIPADLIPHLFEEFIREERVKKETLGTGLGLFIARKIVEAHSGRIWAESDGKDKGSRFYVALKKVQ